MGLLMIGCSNSAYWISWIITGFIFSAIMSTLMHFIGCLFGFSVFINAPFYVMFLIIFSVSIMELTVAYLMLTLVSTQSTAYTISYTFILVTVITTMALLDSAVIYKLFFNIDMPEDGIQKYFLFIFELMPSFHFTKLYSDMTRVVCYHLCFEGMLWLPGREWELADLFKETQGQFMTKDRYLVPSMYSTLLKILRLSIGYFILALYFDNILPSNRGSSKPYLFFLYPAYWFPSLFSKGYVRQ